RALVHGTLEVHGGGENLRHAADRDFRSWTGQVVVPAGAEEVAGAVDDGQPGRTTGAGRSLRACRASQPGRPPRPGRAGRPCRAGRTGGAGRTRRTRDTLLVPVERVLVVAAGLADVRIDHPELALLRRARLAVAAVDHTVLIGDARLHDARHSE